MYKRPREDYVKGSVKEIEKMKELFGERGTFSSETIWFDRPDFKFIKQIKKFLVQEELGDIEQAYKTLSGITSSINKASENFKIGRADAALDKQRKREEEEAMVPLKTVLPPSPATE